MDRKQAIRELVSFRDNAYGDLNNGLNVQELHRNYAASFDKAIRVVESIESDIKKPVIPDFMDVFIKLNKKGLEGDFIGGDLAAELVLETGKEIMMFSFGYKPEYMIGITTEVAKWYYDNKLDYVNAVMHGYTVEEEKRWYVKDPVTKQFLKRTSNGSVWSTFLNHPSKYTEKEIKNMNPVYWDYKTDIKEEGTIV